MAADVPPRVDPTAGTDLSAGLTSRSGAGPGSGSKGLGAMPKFLRELAVILLVATVVSVAVKTYLIRPFYIPSPSMANTLKVDDRILVNELVPGAIPIARGDIVVFRDPAHWLPPAAPGPTGIDGVVAGALTAVGLSASDSGDHLIKRVIGLAGDTVACCTEDGSLTVNGTPIHEPYIVTPDRSYPAAPLPFTATVPAGHLWVMGDNRYQSADSAYHFASAVPSDAFVPVDNVVGRAFVVSWPSARWAWLDSPSATFDHVAAHPVAK